MAKLPNNRAAANSGDAAPAWADRASELALWSERRMLNRRDVYGGYRSFAQRGRTYRLRNGRTGRLGRTTTWHARITRQVLARHFAASGPESVVGVHAIAPGNTSLWCGVDIDRHDDAEDAAANQRAALAWFDKLRALGLRPLLTDSNGNGGFHLLVLFKAPLPAAQSHSFARWIVSDHADHGLGRPPEIYPRQAALTEKCPLGNWLRLPGRHHTRSHWSRVWNGRAWLEGGAAIDYILRLHGDRPALIAEITRGRTDRNARKNVTHTRSQPLEYLSTCVNPPSGAVPPAVDAAISQTIPVRVGQRHRAIWRLVGKFLDLRNVLTWTPGLKLAAFDRWWQRAQSVVGTRDRQVSLDDYFAAWGSRKWGEGGALATIIGSALLRPLPDLPLSETGRKLASICRELSRNDGAFFLGTRTPAKALGVSHVTVHNLLNAMIGLGVLRVVNIGESYAGGLASEYQWCGEKLTDPSPAILRPSKRRRGK
jgi:hypothetical protein